MLILTNIFYVTSKNRYKIHRLLAGCFIGEVKDMEVHHIDQNRKNNTISNLEILSFEKHRGKGSHNKNHNM